MKILYISKYNHLNDILKEEQYIFKDPSILDINYGSSYNEIHHHLYQELIEPFISRIHAIIIDNSITVLNSNNSFPFELASYYRLSKTENWDVPIYYSNFEEDGINHFKNLVNDPTGISSTERFNLITKDSFKNNLNGTSQIYSLIKRDNNNDLEWDSFINKISVKDAISNSHQITNEWGAVKLANNCGYSSKDIGFDYPNTLYFKYLASKFGKNNVDEKYRKSVEISKEYGVTDPSTGKINFKQKYGDINAILIDDNADKGWSQLLTTVLGCKINICISILELIELMESNEVKFEEVNIIFLDLYMPNPSNNNQYGIEYSFELLRIIKEKYPHIPVIIFTASNKSWNYEKVIEFGADGIYIKESPEFADNKDFTKGNFESFIDVIDKTLEKYAFLGPYWACITKIINSGSLNNIKEKFNDYGDTQLSNRINERLKMFYGLLKQGYEQTEYNKKQFHFSNYQLAFMTLWSVLNEISEAFYEKSQPETEASDNSGQLISHHPDNKTKLKYFKHHFLWKIVDQDEIFVDYNFKLRYDKSKNPETYNYGNKYKLLAEQYSTFNRTKNKNKFESTARKPTVTNYQNTLFLQIGFLLEFKDNLKNKAKKKSFQENLIKLNDIRNRLYLTHGDDLSDGFYNDTVSEKNTNSIKKDIVKLFNLVVFLLTGDDGNYV